MLKDQPYIITDEVWSCLMHVIWFNNEVTADYTRISFSLWPQVASLISQSYFSVFEALDELFPKSVPLFLFALWKWWFSILNKKMWLQMEPLQTVLLIDLLACLVSCCHCYLFNPAINHWTDVRYWCQQKTLILSGYRGKEIMICHELS